MPAPRPPAALAHLADLGADATHRDVEDLLRGAGWERCGAGDWAIALASPEGDVVARISPFDPVGPHTARLYDVAAATGQVPRLFAHRQLAGGGDLQVMERLHEVPESTAAAFLEQFARPDPSLAELAAAVQHVHADALRDLPWCGPLDTNPSNIMRARDGHLVMIDPFYADGPNLYAMAQGAPDLFVATLPERQRRFLTEIPLAASGPWPAAEREALRESLRQADLRRGPDRRAGSGQRPPPAAPGPAGGPSSPGTATPLPTADELIAEAAAADVDGWGFTALEGRATEERPPWKYVGLLGDAVAAAQVAVDLDTGGGEVLAECPHLAAEQHVTEGWPPNAARARELLGPRGVTVHEVAPGSRIPVPGGTFDLVTARHPVAPDWPEIARVLSPGGEYLAQHVGPSSAFELIEHFIGPTTEEQRRGRHPEDEVAAAEAAGLQITELRTARLRMEFFDVGAVVWILRKCVWWVPGFTVERFHEELLAMDAIIRRDGPFVAHSTRHLLRARR